MIFSKSAIAVAIGCSLFGLLSLVLGVCAAIGLMGPDDMARYVGNSRQAIDRGVLMVLFAVALGTLAEINLSIRKATE